MFVSFTYSSKLHRNDLHEKNPQKLERIFNFFFFLYKEGWLGILSVRNKMPGKINYRRGYVRLCNIWNRDFTRQFMTEGIQFKNNHHLCGVTKERCELNRAHQEMINRSGNSAGGNSNQKLSLQDSCVSWWVGFLQSHGDVYIWVGHPKLLAQAVEPWCVVERGVWFILFQSRYPQWPDKPQVESGHSPHWAVQGAWAEQFSCRLPHCTGLEGSGRWILSFLST